METSPSRVSVAGELGLIDTDSALARQAFFKSPILVILALGKQTSALAQPGRVIVPPISARRRLRREANLQVAPIHTLKEEIHGFAAECEP